MRLSTKVAYNAIIQIISKILSTILGLAAISLMTRYLGTAGYGEYTTITTFLSFFAVFIDFGLTLTTVQMIGPLGASINDKIKENKILDNLFTFRIFSSILFLSVAPIVSYFLPYDHNIKWGIAVCTLSFFFIALNQILVGIFQKNLRMDKVSIAEVASRIVLLAAIVHAVWAGNGIMGIIWATIISSAVSFFLHFIFSRKFNRLRISFDFSLWKEIMAKSWPLAITIVFNLIYLRTDTLILSLIKPQSDVGIYGAAYKVIDVLITVPFMFAGIVLPILTARWALGDHDKFNRVLQKSLDLMLILAIPLVLGTQFLARPIMITVAGAEFASAGRVLQILIIAAGIIFLGCMFSHVIIAIDQQKRIIKYYIFTAITALIGYLIFIPMYSYLGAAWVTIYSELSIALAAAWLAIRHSSFRPDLRILIKIIPAAALMMATQYLLEANYSQTLISWRYLSISLFISVLVYFAALIVFRGVTKKDIDDLMNR